MSMTAGVHSRTAESSERSRPADARAPSYPLSQGMRVTWELSALFSFGTLLMLASSTPSRLVSKNPSEGTGQPEEVARWSGIASGAVVGRPHGRTVAAVAPVPGPIVQLLEHGLLPPAASLATA